MDRNQAFRGGTGGGFVGVGGVGSCKGKRKSLNVGVGGQQMKTVHQIACPKNLLRLFFRNSLSRLKITSESQDTKITGKGSLRAQRLKKLNLD